ncbi:MAG: TIGR02300 family protein [Vannielia sp.]|uniref:TIGR02300 family protein n=1 Tax=Rhodobacterales TaxID=204455 RepID=UPI00209594CB|nr:TIGR02300 family protein [Oceanicola sp. 502str15]MCO6383261.1 TIGR02300 family protein [Oceanicola sp. 502str15]
MPKEEWGVKRVCPTTGKRFYDLGKDPIVSPYTGEVVQLDTGGKARSALKGDKPDPKSVEAEEDDADLDVLEDDNDDDTDVDLGDDVLEDDDDDEVSLDDIADVASEDED